MSKKYNSLIYSILETIQNDGIFYEKGISNKLNIRDEIWNEIRTFLIKNGLINLEIPMKNEKSETCTSKCKFCSFSNNCAGNDTTIRYKLTKKATDWIINQKNYN